MKNECSNCRFFQPFGYFCRRYPKQYAPKWNTFQFPVVDANDWCGEYKEHKKEVVSKEYLVTAEPIKYIPVEEEPLTFSNHRHLEIELIEGEFISLRFDYDDDRDVWYCDMKTYDLDRFDDIIEEFEDSRDRKSK